MTARRNRREKFTGKYLRRPAPAMLALCVFLCAVLELAGCGAASSDSAEAFGRSDLYSGQKTEDQAGIELIEPVQLTQTWEAAAYRNLYDSQIFAAAVVPEVTEYAFPVGGTLEEFGAYPGDTVEEGSLLAELNREQIDQSVEDLEEKIRTMEEEFAGYREDMLEKIAEADAEAAELQAAATQAAQTAMQMTKADAQAVQAAQGIQADAQAVRTAQAGQSAAQATQAPDAQSAQIAAEAGNSGNAAEAGGTAADSAEGDYRILLQQNDTLRRKLTQRTQLYELDHAYQLDQLEKRKDQQEQYLLKSDMAGDVVAYGMMTGGDRIGAERNVIAVGDLSRKYLKCEYISQSVLNGADAVYAVIRGKRREICNIPLGAGEYTRLTNLGETVCSTFEIEDDGDVAVGDFAVVVVIEDCRREVLAVPADAVSRSGLQHYVYVKDGEKSVKTPVTTGMSDDVYTEIRSGLAEGDQVLVKSTSLTASGTEQTAVTRGDFAADFTGSGVFYYPCTYRVTDPVSHGTVYFQNYEVTRYQPVKKGDVIATVRVEKDEVALRRSETKLKRLEERLNDLIRSGEKDEDVLAARREEIAGVKEEIASMNEDFDTEAIVATHDGIVTELAEHKKEDLLRTDELMAVIARQDNCYVIVENKGQLLNYGNKLTVTYESRNGGELSAEGVVANVSASALSGALASDYALLRVPEEAVSEMAAAAENDSEWNIQMRFTVEGSARQMEDVLLVPKAAVTSQRGQNYVTVIDENGQKKAVSFVAGGSDSRYYWAAEGLTEGMVLCLK